MKKMIVLLLVAVSFLGCSQPQYVTFKVPVEDLAKIVRIDAKSDRIDASDMYVCFNQVNTFPRDGNYVLIQMDEIVWLSPPRSHFFTVEGYRSDLQYKMAISLASLKKYPLMVFPKEEK